jgi:hypothetical protein
VPVAIAAIARFGGRGIAGGKLERLDGGPPPTHHHRVPGFGDGSPLAQVGRIQPAAKVRLATSHGRVVPIDGVEP